MLFDIIYDYFYSLFNSTRISGYSVEIMSQSTSMAQWLAVTATIAVMVILIIIMCLVVRWVFRVCAGLVRAF